MIGLSIELERQITSAGGLSHSLVSFSNWMNDANSSSVIIGPQLTRKLSTRNIRIITVFHLDLITDWFRIDFFPLSFKK